MEREDAENPQSSLAVKLWGVEVRHTWDHSDLTGEEIAEAFSRLLLASEFSVQTIAEALEITAENLRQEFIHGQRESS